MDESPTGVVDDDATPASRDRSRRLSRSHRRASAIGVIGEVLLTVGVITLLFVVWQLWLGDLIYGTQRNATGHELSQTWAHEFAPPSDLPSPAATPTGTDETTQPAAVEPVILPQPSDGQVFGILHVPRFGSDYAVEMAGGISRDRTLDPIGVGHYPGTSMPGQVGNFAVAAHRTTWGKPFNRLADLHVGDAIVIETPDGWYTYRFRTLEYVTPNAAGVLLPVPQAVTPPAATRYITMTSCSPMYAMSERIVAFGVFDSFTPRSAGAPASLTEAAS